MPKRQRIKLNARPIGGFTDVRSRKVARRLTSQYHEINNEVAQIDYELHKLSSSSLVSQKHALESRRKELLSKLEDNGGVHRYQQASVVSTEYFKTSRFVVRTLQHLGYIPTKGGHRLRTLEVGAINTQLQECPFLSIRAIDLHSQHPSIETKDFNTLHHSTFFSFDVVVSSMVVNCVPNPYGRFEMLMRLALSIKPGGCLFLMLPIRCIQSKHLGGKGAFRQILTALGLRDILPEHHTPKIAFYVLERRKEAQDTCNEIKAASDTLEMAMITARQAMSPKLRKNLSKKKLFLVPPSDFCLCIKSQDEV